MPYKSDAQRKAVWAKKRKKAKMQKTSAYDIIAYWNKVAEGIAPPNLKKDVLKSLAGLSATQSAANLAKNIPQPKPTPPRNRVLHMNKLRDQMRLPPTPPSLPKPSAPAAANKPLPVKQLKVSGLLADLNS